MKDRPTDATAPRLLPRLRRARARTKTLSGALGLVAALVLQQALPAQQPPPSPVVVAKVQQKEIATGQTYVGTVMPAKRSAVGSAVDGRVVEYPINVGDRVAKGQPLCRLLTETIQLQIAAAQAEGRIRAEELRELENGSRPEEIAQAQARMEAAAAARDFTAARHKRALQLSQQGQITQEQVEEIHSAAIAAERTLNAAEQEHKLLVQGPRAEKIAQAKAKRDVQAELVLQLEDQLKKHTMIAPFDGYVIEEKTEVGEWVQRSQIVAQVVYLDDVEIEAHVLDANIDAMRVGMPVRVEVTALKQPLFIGEVAHVSPQADLKSRTFPVRVRVKNVIREDGPTLKGGMVARVSLPVGNSHDALAVPKDAIVFGGAAPVVYVVVPLAAAPPATAKTAAATGATKSAVAEPGPPPDGVKPVPVELGVADGNWVEVRGNLAAGDRVVTLGNERLRPGQAVRVVKEVEVGPTAESAKHSLPSGASTAAKPDR